MSSPKFTAPETPVTREEVYYDAILRGLNGDSPAPVIPTPVWRMEEYLAAIAESASSGGSSLPSVTSSDNGKVLAVMDGAWAASVTRLRIDFSYNGTSWDTNPSIVDRSALHELVSVGGVVELYVDATGSSVESLYSGVLSPIVLSYCGNIGSTIAFRSLSDAYIPFGYVTFDLTSDEYYVSVHFPPINFENVNKYIVTLTPTAPDYSGTMDMTVAEINAAYEAGQEIVFKLQTSASSYIEVPVQLVGHETTLAYPSFETSVVQSVANVQVFAYTSATDDGTKATYSTAIYPLTPAS